MKITEEKSFWENLREQFKNFVTAALGLVAALAWNDAIRTLIAQLFPEETKSALIGKFTYAFIITVLAVAMIYYLNKADGILAKINKKRNDKKSKN